MRWLASILVVACGGGASVERATPAPPVGARATLVERSPARAARDPIELFVALAQPPSEASWIAPGPLQLELGATVFESASTQPLPVTIVERQGSQVRVAVNLEGLHFGAWVDRAWVLSIIARDQRVAPTAGGGGDVLDPNAKGPIEVVLRAGAQVRRIARTNGWTQLRYLGPFEVNGWVPDSVLVDEAPPRQRFGRIPTGGRQLMLMRGAVFRTRPEWTARELALMNTGYVVSTVRELDSAWVEISYADDDVRLHGYVSRHAPPGRVHQPGEREATEPLAPNATAASGTCLHARASGEPIGFIVGDRPVELVESGTPGWWTLVVETPWRAVAFLAKGSTRETLATCGPGGAPAAPPASVP